MILYHKRSFNFSRKVHPRQTLGIIRKLITLRIKQSIAV